MTLTPTKTMTNTTLPYSPPVDFLDLLLDAICVVDPDGRFVYASAASEQVFGYRPDEMISCLMPPTISCCSARLTA